jgi:hypothetical protein
MSPTIPTDLEPVPHPPKKQRMEQNPSQTNQKEKPKNLKKIPIQLAEFVKNIVLIFCEM